MPRVSVLLPVYNAEKYLAKAIDSVLRQTFADFELLIIDDGSTDSSREIINSFKDDRIKFLKNESNLKLIKTLNKGIELASGEFIARMDADDICFPQRFERQLAFFESRPELGVCGTFAIRINEGDYHRNVITRPTGDKLPLNIWRPAPLIHPTVMLKTNLAKQFLYNENCLHCEDYELWIRMLNAGVKIDNYPAPLLYYRVHGAGVSSQNRRVQLQNSYEVFKKYFEVELTYDEYCALIGVHSNISIIRRLRLYSSIQKNLDVFAIGYQLLQHLKGKVPFEV